MLEETLSETETPCSSTSYMRGHPVLTWNYNQSTVPYNIESWVHSLPISAGGVVGQSGIVKNSPNSGISWHWRNTNKISNRMKMNGFLYGQVDSEGKFSGENICFIYPDFLTGLRGLFKDGVLHTATAVTVVGERCNNGVKELQLERAGEVMWVRGGAGYGENPREMDPHERKSVFVGQSTNPRATQGLFARRKFSRGDLVSYYGGKRLFLRDIVHPNMTAEEVAKATMYTLVLGENMQGLLVDVSQKYASITEYRTTLGHKANHKFKNHNTIYQKGIDHPVLGNIGCIIAITDIEAGDEIFTNYNYDLHTAAQWYRDEYTSQFGQTLP